MKKIIINDDKLSDIDIETNVVRVKGIIINAKGKVLLAHNNYTYQFPGGHVEENEDLDTCIIREIKDETGISLNVKEEPFLSIITYDNNYFNTGKKVKNTIYYYRFFTDLMPNIDETHYDSLELETDFNLFYVDFKGLKEFIHKSMLDGQIDGKIAREMDLVIENYVEIYGGVF